MRAIRFSILILALVVAGLFSLTQVASADDDVTFASKTQAGDTPLTLYGKDLLVYMIWDAYQLALYLPEGVSGKQVLTDVPKKVLIHYLVDIDAEDFGPAGDKILAKNISKAEMAVLRPRLDKINAAYEAIEEGERYSLTYVPGEGTTLSKNGRKLVTIPGADFAAAYFQIWFGVEPVDEDLRDHVLAGKK